MKLTRLQAVWLLVAAVLLFDQALKIWIKLHFSIGESHPVLGSYLQLYFIENEGMAFGMTLPGDCGKLALSLFRIAAVLFIGWWLGTLARDGSHRLVLMGMGLILAGAFGNILDSAFYGLVFSASDSLHPATLFPPEGGYERFLHGHVVDMLRVDLFEINLFGKTYHFFEPIFNVADASITIGVVLFLVGSVFFEKKNKEKEMAAPAQYAAVPSNEGAAATSLDEGSDQSPSEGPSDGFEADGTAEGPAD